MVEQEWNVEAALKHVFNPYEVTLSEDDCILYALGVGFSKKALNNEHYRFTYE